jgi:hypothetical protein
MEGLPFLAGGGVNLTGLQIVDITRIFFFSGTDSTISERPDSPLPFLNHLFTCIL